MSVLMSWSGGCFDLLGYPEKWLVVAPTMVMEEVNFWQETLLEKLR